MEQVNRPIAAAASILLGMSIISFIDNFIGTLARDGGVWQFLFLRGLMIFALLIGWAILTGQSMRPRRAKGVVLRSLFMTIAMAIYFSALGFLPVAQTLAGLFTSPIFVLVISALFLGQRIGIWRILAVGAGFLGILLVLEPWQAGFSPFMLFPVLAGLFYALGVIATRHWCAGETTFALVAGNFLGLSVLATLGLVWFTLVPVAAPDFVTSGWITPSPAFWAITAMQAIGSLLGVIGLTRGYQLGEASYVTVFEYSVLVFAAAWGFVLWREVLPLSAALGILLIIAAGAVIALRSREVVPENAPV